MLVSNSKPPINSSCTAWSAGVSGSILIIGAVAFAIIGAIQPDWFARGVGVIGNPHSWQLWVISGSALVCGGIFLRCTLCRGPKKTNLLEKKTVKKNTKAHSDSTTKKGILDSSNTQSHVKPQAVKENKLVPTAVQKSSAPEVNGSICIQGSLLGKRLGKLPKTPCSVFDVQALRSLDGDDSWRESETTILIPCTLEIAKKELLLWLPEPFFRNQDGSIKEEGEAISFCYKQIDYHLKIDLRLKHERASNRFSDIFNSACLHAKTDLNPFYGDLIVGNDPVSKRPRWIQQFYSEKEIRWRMGLEEKAGSYQLKVRPLADPLTPGRRECGLEDPKYDPYLKQNRIGRPSISTIVLDNHYATMALASIDPRSLDIVFYDTHITMHAFAPPVVYDHLFAKEVLDKSAAANWNKQPLEYLISLYYVGCYLPPQIGLEISRVIKLGEDPSSVIKKIEYELGFLTIHWNVSPDKID